MADTVWDLNKAINTPDTMRKIRADSDPVVGTPKEKASDIIHPGGFRRHHVRKQNKKPVSQVTRENIVKKIHSVYDPFISSMLTQDNDEYEEFSIQERIKYCLETPQIRGSGRIDHSGRLTERAPILDKKPSEKSATLWHALLGLLKAFVGTGVLFLPQGFLNGGILFSPLVLAFVAFLTIYAMIRLLQCRSLVGGSYGFIGKQAYGIWGRRMVQVSIVLMQAGFCCTYIIFVAQNMQDVFSYFGYGISMGSLIVVQAIVYIPLSWIRQIRYFAVSNLIADAFILYGLAYILSNSIHNLSDNGVKDVIFFNQVDYPVFIGTAVFTFEGIGLVIPTQASLNAARQKKFESLLVVTIIGLLIFYTFFAGINYAAFGSSIQPIVTSSLPRSGWSISVQFGYSIAQLLSYPLFLFPAVSIIEEAMLFPKRMSGKRCQKNFVRSLTVGITILVAYCGHDHLDLFVSIVGAFCCVPLSFIYPPLFYLKLAPKASWISKFADLIVIVIGTLTFVFVTMSNLSKWTGH